MKNLILCLALLLCSVVGISQNRISGVVTNSTSLSPIPKATVILEVSGEALITDSLGQFEFNDLANGIYSISILALGCEQTKMNVIVDGADVLLDIKLVQTQESIDLNEYPLFFWPITVSANIEVTRVGEKSPIAHTDIPKSEIEKINLGQDLPVLLEMTPSMVSTSDAGAGVGYTAMRMRGSDQSRINVTINGVPLNDAESQNVFWVDLPDFATSVDHFQIQRGVGSSTNGAGAFGGSVKLSTLDETTKPYGNVNLTAGSFETYKQSVGFGTGLINGKWGVQGRLSQIQSSGYVDRATSDLKSYFLSAGYYGDKSTVKAVTFGGKELTYQAWNGVPESRLNNDQEGMLTHAANNGFDEEETENLLRSGRTYNYYTYKNQVDDYNQDHYQLHWTQEISENSKFNLSGHYTYGRGFYEQFRKSDDFSDYGIQDIFIHSAQGFSDGFDQDGDPINNAFNSQYSWDEIELTHTMILDDNNDPIQDGDGNFLLFSKAGISNSDIVRRRWLSNDFYGAVGSYVWNVGKFSNVIGGGWNEYKGDHFGELVWMEHPNNVDPGAIYYLNKATKNDFNIYGKTDLALNDQLNLFLDVQYRTVAYAVSGTDNDLRRINVNDQMTFINPKGGVHFSISSKDAIYGSYSIGNREPQRNDYVDALEGMNPKPEQMQDIELGYKRKHEKYSFGANFYYMQYKDQLVMTGELNDVGSPIRVNVDNSYRRGLELEAAFNPIKKLRISGNATFSENKISSFDERLYDYGEGTVQSITHENADISFSPDLIAAAMAEYVVFKKEQHELNVGWMFKHVGKQYLDNTSNNNRSLDAYAFHNLRFSYVLRGGNIKQLELTFMINNVLDQLYESNGYTYSYIYGETVTENFYYPQAGRHFLMGLNFHF